MYLHLTFAVAFMWTVYLLRCGQGIYVDRRDYNYSFANTAHVIENWHCCAAAFLSLRSSLARNVDLYIFNGNLNGKHWIFRNSRPYVSNDFDGFSTQLLYRNIQLSSHYCKSLGLSEPSVRWYILAETLTPVIVFVLVDYGSWRRMPISEPCQVMETALDGSWWTYISPKRHI